jgi:hypothetical protein
MKISQLKDIIREMINEELEENLRRTDKKDKGMVKQAFGPDKNKTKKNAFARSLGGGQKTTGQGGNDAQKLRAGRAVLKGVNSPKIKNPQTGQEILATTAYKAGSTHPAYTAAKAALKKEVAQYLEEGIIDFIE